jgi:hypothetical protein
MGESVRTAMANSGNQTVVSNGATLDALMDEATVRSTTKYVHTDIERNDYGFTLVVRDAAPIEVIDEDGDEVTHHVGKAITAGTGRTLTQAIAMATAGLKSVF